jgi:hypothetical protein
MGKFRVNWVWVMTNQQGYFDGLRIQLTAKKVTRVFEFISICSSFEIHEAIQLSNKSPDPALASSTLRAEHGSRHRYRERPQRFPGE